MKYEDQLDMVVTGDHDAEMMQLVMTIEEKGREELEAIVAEAESAGEGNGEALREVWERDVHSRKQFFEDQLKNRKFTHVCVFRSELMLVRGCSV